MTRSSGQFLQWIQCGVGIVQVEDTAAHGCIPARYVEILRRINGCFGFCENGTLGEQDRQE